MILTLVQPHTNILQETSQIGFSESFPVEHLQNNCLINSVENVLGKFPKLETMMIKSSRL